MNDDKLQPEHPMKVTPLDLRQTRFKTAMRGYDKTEVATLLEAVADDYEYSLRETDRLRQEVARLEAVLTQHRELEGSLKTMLISAQKVADDLRETAQAEALRIVREAEGRSELLQQKAFARLEDVQREIDGLKMKRREAEAGVEAVISSLQNTLEFIREQGTRDAITRDPGTAPRVVEIARPA
jgi:cell division initiation protein